MSRLAQSAAQAVELAAVGPLEALPPATLAALLRRTVPASRRLESEVRAIIRRVREEGDAALRELARLHDGVELDSLEVPRSAWEVACARLEPAVRAALEQCIANLRAFHRAQLPAPLEVEPMPGVRLRRVTRPLDRAGIYAPGGRAAYPSSLLMGLVPARCAGVREVIVCSPPGPDGLPSPIVLAACALGGADRVFALGGAGAITAMACGTMSVPRVDRVVGPGNAWVAEAKRQLAGDVAIDCPAGPSELLILADASADAQLIATELLAQAEHDPDAAVLLVTTEPAHIDAVRLELGRQLEEQLRAPVIRTALARQGALLLAHSLDAAIAFANDYAAEHLLLLLRAPAAALDAVRHAGTIFVGAASSVAFGDYLTGANHVLPTGGASRSFSGLGTQDFLRFVTVQEVSDHAAARLAAPTAVFAEAEGLPAHAAAARLRSGATETSSFAAIRRAPRLRAAYVQVTVYDPGREPCAIDLSDNTNLFGACPAVTRAIESAGPEALTRYPGTYAARIKQAAARGLSLEPANITTGCGSDDLIDSALRAFCEPGDVLAYPDPTFGVVPLFARMNAVMPRPVPLKPDFQLDVNALLAAGARTIYLCSPNNPVGNAFRRADVLRLMQEFDGVILLDEAYADFAGGDLLQDVMRSSNTISLRTLSKAAGMAGLRVGLAAGPADLIAEIEKSRGPYKVNQLAELAAVAALDHGRAWIANIVATVRTNRDRLTRCLQDMGQTVLPSDANFVLLPVGPDAAANQVAERLRARGIAVRPFPALPLLGDCIRVTIGPWPMMEAFLDAFTEVRNSMRGNGRA